MSSRTARATQRNPVSKNKKLTKKRKKEKRGREKEKEKKKEKKGRKRKKLFQVLEGERKDNIVQTPRGSEWLDIPQPANNQSVLE